MFSFLESSFLGFYEYLYSLTNDYGLALIIFVFLLRIILLPLNYLIFLEEKKLKKIKPLIEEIIKKMKKDYNPLEYLETIDKIYKKENFNPLRNIFLNFLPLPILFSVFFVLKKILDTKTPIYFLNFLDLSKINYPLILITLILQIIFFLTFNKERTKEQIIFFLIIALIIFNFPALFVFYWLLNLIFMFMEKKLFEIYDVKFGVVSVEKNDS